MLCFQKETPAEKRAREREEAKAAKAAAKASEATARLAESSALKLDQVVVQLQTIVAHSQFHAMPHIVSKPITEALAEFQTWRETCNLAINAELPEPLPFDVKTLTMAINKSKKDRRARMCGGGVAERLSRQTCQQRSAAKPRSSTVKATVQAAQPPGDERLSRQSVFFLALVGACQDVTLATSLLATISRASR